MGDMTDQGSHEVNKEDEGSIFENFRRQTDTETSHSDEEERKFWNSGDCNGGALHGGEDSFLIN